MNEISITAGLTVNKGSLQLNRTAGTQASMAGTHFDAKAQSVGTGAHELLNISADIAAAGYCYLRNLDAENYVDIGVDVGGVFYPLLRLKAGEVAVVRFAIKDIYALASTADVALEFWMIED
jgi:hypothetical protein